MPLVLYMMINSIHSFFFLTTALLKSDVFGTQKSTPPTVFNLQASNWVYCEEETGAYYQLSRSTSKMVTFLKKLLTLLFLPHKYAIFKKFHKFIINLKKKKR